MLGTSEAYEQLTSLSTVKATGAVLGAVPTGTYAALIACESQNVRWLDTGDNPTATSGMVMKTTDPPLAYRGDVKTLRFIESAAGAKVNIIYYSPF